jgi:hypothetical protein
VLADAGYWHQVQMERLLGDGHTVLIPPDAKKRAGARPGWDGGLYAFMRRVLATDRGKALYRKRHTTVEPVFGQMKFNRRLDRFLRRGRSAVRSEWRLFGASIAVGTALAGGPPHRSQRALLTHWAPALGGGVEARVWPGVQDPDSW